MFDAITVADEFLRIAKQHNKRLTPLQLMKLVYIAHGWSFPVRRKDLFENRIEAWKYGPVIPDLYHATKHFGRDQIPAELVADADSVATDNETREFLEDVFEKYGHLSGIALSDLTHRAGTPWSITFEPNVFGKEIPDRLIKQHYEKLYYDRQRGAAA